MPTINAPTSSAEPSRPSLATRSVRDFPALATHAVEYLRANNTRFALDQNESTWIVSLMHVLQYPAGANIFRAGEKSDPNYMLLILQGDVSVDTGKVGGATPVEISVVCPGTLMGELALIDDSPRSATCTAITPVTALGLSEAGMRRLSEAQPKTALKLAMYIASTTAERLRSLSEQLQMYDQLTQSLQNEVNQLRSMQK
jgi:CRP/FNR family transcriptional regulator, cyclic AMP receptor protein